MKKTTFLALAASLALAPATSFAESWEKDVTNADEFTEAINSLGSGIAGETYVINCLWDANTNVSIGRIRPELVKGRLVIRSNETDFDKQPRLTMYFEYQSSSPAVETNPHCTNAELGQRLSIIFENMTIISTGSYLIDNRNDLYADTFAIRHCDYSGSTRSMFRFDGDRTLNNETAAGNSIDVIEIRESRIHGIAQSSGDNWSVVRAFDPTNTITIKDNMFYDIPYTKSILETRYPVDVATNLEFSNNLVMVAQNKSMQSSGFTVLMTDTTMVAGTEFHVYNNVFIAPMAGTNILIDESSTYGTDTKLTDAHNVVMMVSNNVIDYEKYMDLTSLSDLMLSDGSTLIDFGTNMALADFTDFSWDTGATFQDPDNDIYNMLRTVGWYSSGYDDGMGHGASYVGPSIAYVDQFPTVANINVIINGPSYITYTVSPERNVYYVGDEVTITLDPQTNNYLTDLNTFNGWSDGVTDLSRTVTLEGDLELTANFTEKEGVLSAFTLNQITSNGSPATYDADIYLNMDTVYRTQVKAIVVDTTTATGTLVSPFHYHEGTFQARPAKFEEDAVSDRMPILSRRTWSGAKSELRDYALFTINTTGVTDVHFSCYVGTDNNAASVQKLEYSLDNENWTEIGQVTIENLTWGLLEGDLPAEANDQEAVYVRVIGDPTSDPVVTPDEGIGMWDGSEVVWDVYNGIDAFEYLGSVLITANTSGVSDGIAGIEADNQTTLDENAPMYNLMGVRVAKGTKGIIIQNGRKFVVK